MPRAPRTPEPAPRQRGGKNYVVTLGGGGTVTVSLNVNPFDLAGTDRTFVFNIVDMVTGYGKNGKPKSNPAEGYLTKRSKYGDDEATELLTDTPGESEVDHGEHTDG